VTNCGAAPSPGYTISVYDAQTRRQTATIDVAPLARPHGLVCAGEFAYFTAESSLAIGRIRLAENRNHESHRHATHREIRIPAPLHRRR